jgi:hypothetical protein
MRRRDDWRPRGEIETTICRAAGAYRGARRVAAAEMSIEKTELEYLFPVECPWTAEQVLDDDFLPEMAPNANGRS